MEGITKSIEARVLFQNLNCKFFEGSKIGILGSNGSGKSTLLKIIAGVDTEYEGAIEVRDGYKIGYLQQEPELDPDKTVHENVLLGIKDKLDLVAEFEEITEAFSDPDADFDELIERQGEVQTQIEHYGCWDLTHKVRATSQALNCPPGDSDVTLLSGGERRRVALCQLLLSDPDILLLDEPTNHLDATSVKWLETFLESYKGLVIAITHDRYFLDNVAGWILEITNGRFYTHEGNYQMWLERKHKRLSNEGQQQEKEAKSMERELKWLRANSGMRGNQKRQQSYDEARAENNKSRSSIALEGGSMIIPEGPRLKSGMIINVKNLGLQFDGRWLFRNLSFTLDSRSVLGIVGPNGVGKSTLIKLIRGQIEPTEGSIEISESATVGYNAQNREYDPSDVVWNTIAEGRKDIIMNHSTGHSIPARAYVAQFNFHGKSQTKTMGMLSGGERNRVHLAKSLSGGCNILLLDEPTNDLDVATLRSLEEGLVTFNGCSIVISHDRFFLDRVCTQVMVYEEEGVQLFDGTYTMYLEYGKKK